MAKTAEQRDAAVAIAQAAFKKWPSLASMPEADGKDSTHRAEVRGPDQQHYVAALYELAHQGATPIGRYPGNPPSVVGSLHLLRINTVDAGKAVKR